jgi:hypothetical protein
MSETITALAAGPSLIESILRADAYFASEQIVLDVGSEANRTQLETALSEGGRGFVVSIPVFIGSGNVTAHSLNKATYDANFEVLIEMATSINENGETGANKDILEAIDKAASLLVTWVPPNGLPNHRFKFQGFDTELIDPGVVSYRLRFTKPCITST